jgi:3-dehydroquinate synthase
MKEIIHKDFEIFLGEEVLEHLAEILIELSYSKIFVLMDTNTQRHCWPILSPYLVNYHPIVIPEGESSKSLVQAEKIWAALHQNLADRNSVLINLGGGVVSDIGGFCAATYKRGIDFINVPTSLLGMVDAAVGGKLGIDFLSFKNSIGLFKHPKYIIVYPDFIKTLSAEETRNGLAEVVKHGLIEDKSLFEKLAQLEGNALEKAGNLIFQSIKIKAQIVKKDPFEKDLRKSLNFGHTIGHAIETWSLLNDVIPLKHGEAIAIGMICESYLSKTLLGLSNSELEQITRYFTQRYPTYKHPWDENKLIALMQHDKKNVDGLINFTLLKKIGKAKININCHEDLIRKSLAYYRQLSQ